MKKISVVVPCYNEEEVIEECYNQLTLELNKYKETYLYELIFVNDGSKDNTLSILKQISKKDNNVKIISFSRNFGHQIGITAGLDYATGDYIGFIDADLQDPPQILMKMLVLADNEGYNVVYGKRIKRKGETLFKKVTASVYYRLLKKITNNDIPVDVGDFRVIDRKVAEVLKSIKEKDRFIRGLVSWIGFKQIGYEFERKERAAGKTKYSLKKMIKLSMDGIFSFSNEPVKIISKLGMFLLVISLVIVLIVFLLRLRNINNLVILISILIVGGINLVCLSFIGEYISRIYNEVRNRPLYIIDEMINF